MPSRLRQSSLRTIETTGQTSTEHTSSPSVSPEADQYKTGQGQSKKSRQGILYKNIIVRMNSLGCIEWERFEIAYAGKISYMKASCDDCYKRQPVRGIVTVTFLVY